VAKICDDAEALLCLLEFPAEHWQHLKTSNPIVSTFFWSGPEPGVTKGPLPSGAGDGVRAARVGTGLLAGGQPAAPHGAVRAGVRF